MRALIIKNKVVALVIVVVIGVGTPSASTAPSVNGEGLMIASVAEPTQTRMVRPDFLPEDMLVEAINELRAGDVTNALQTVDSLLEARPNYRLAHLVRGDLLASIAGAPLSVDVHRGAAVDNLVAEARQRLIGRSFEPGDRLPAPLLKLSNHYQHAVFVDIEKSRLYLFQNFDGQPVLVDDYYVSAGKNGYGKRRKGDKKTPIGVYFVTARLPGESLPDRYGPVAFPVDYPNEWDRRNGRTGNGIWVHGMASGSYSRPPADSDGCVALVNEQLETVAPHLLPGSTPVVIGYGEQWLPRDEVSSRRESVERAVETWRADWSSGDSERYLAHYSDDFSGRGMNLSAWSSYKRRVMKGKEFVDVDVSNVSVFGYPQEEDMVVVTFRQHYRSSNFNSQTHKRQYWRRDADGSWRIVSEDVARTGTG